MYFTLFLIILFGSRRQARPHINYREIRRPERGPEKRLPFWQDSKIQSGHTVLRQNTLLFISVWEKQVFRVSRYRNLRVVL